MVGWSGGDQIFDFRLVKIEISISHQEEMQKQAMQCTYESGVHERVLSWKLTDFKNQKECIDYWECYSYWTKRSQNLIPGHLNLRHLRGK